MRELARGVAEAYLKQREEMGYPWRERPSAPVPKRPSIQERVRHDTTIQGHLDALLEIGTEELPARDLSLAIEQLREAVPRMLEEARLEHGGGRIAGTPRRLVVYVEGLAPKQRDVEKAVKGPPAQVAYDAEGKPTRAAIGFAKSQGVALEDLEVREIEGGKYVVAVKVEEGRPAMEVLAELWPQLIASLRFPLTMRWNETGVAFSRPIRWLVALLGDAVVPFEYAGVRSGRTTRGLRPQGSPEIVVGRAEDYFALMEENGIVVDVEKRREMIRRQAERLAAEVGGRIPDDPALLEEVANLVEHPTALRGSFDPEYLKLPKEVLITVMKKHQRYFPVVGKLGNGNGHRRIVGFLRHRSGDRHADDTG
ncbi:MAG TPA: glycine--tRNA ligase subunit beta, partial [Anaerolineae bacterium]|nr:glycine--tRNA ligase subunit beta [Anaerolineae bacterium]